MKEYVNKIIVFFLVHIIAIGIIVFIYQTPSLLEGMRNPKLIKNHIGSVVYYTRASQLNRPWEMLLLALPAMILTMHFGGKTDFIGKSIGFKIKMSLFLILNILVTLGYVIAIDSYFRV